MSLKGVKAEGKDTGHVQLDKFVRWYLGGMISGFEETKENV